MQKRNAGRVKELAAFKSDELPIRKLFCGKCQTLDTVSSRATSSVLAVALLHDFHAVVDQAPLAVLNYFYRVPVSSQSKDTSNYGPRYLKFCLAYVGMLLEEYHWPLSGCSGLDPLISRPPTRLGSEPSVEYT